MADITLESFDGLTFPKDVTRSIMTKGLSGAPIFSALTQRVTNNAEVVWPLADPSGWDWTAELAEIPAVNPGDDTAVIVPRKLAGRILLSNESIADTEMQLADEVGRLIAEGLASKADRDLAYGAGPAPTPTGYYDTLDSGSGDTVRSAVVDACQQILAAGGTPTTVILSPSLWGEEMARREDSMVASGALFDDLGLGLDVRVASTLDAGDGLVLDRSGCFGVLRSDYSIEASRESSDAWLRDGVSLRVKARLAVGIPTPDKHARSVAVLSS